jgi:NAD(P)-dependent dehydrogenase (short-subunit alcohol dehydrogenase family)
MDSENKIVLVTGGNRGIGLEICRQLYQKGCTVIMGSRNPEKGIQAAASIGPSVIARQLDVTSEHDITALAGFVMKEFGKLDVLINNAGVNGSYVGNASDILSGVRDFMETRSKKVSRLLKTLKPFLRKAGILPNKKTARDVSMQNVRDVMETNLYGPWRMIQAFIPLLANSDDPRIINMSSGMGELKSLNGIYPGYSLSKSSLNALTIMFSNELKNKGISVNAMCPGWVRTDMGGPNATREVAEGADTATWLATKNEITTGKFYRDRKEIDW